MQSCACGHLGDPRKPCWCTPAQLERYRSRISGPILDRLDLGVSVPAVPIHELAGPAVERVHVGEAAAFRPELGGRP